MARDHMYDSLKFFAGFIIFTTHFISEYAGEAFRLWDTYPTKYVLGGLTGKFGTALFGVILGYFAYNSGLKRKRTVLEYSLKRYIYFFTCGLFINFIYIFKEQLASHFNIGRYVFAAKEAAFINSSIYETFWCMKDFLIASVICYVLGMAGAQFRDNLIVTVLLCISFPWIGICLMGTLIDGLLEQKKNFAKFYVQIPMILFFFLLLRRPESTVTYLIQGFCALMLIIIGSCNKYFNNFLNFKLTAKLGETCMAVFLIHRIVYFLVALLMGTGKPLLLWIVSAVAIYTLAIPVNKFLQFISGEIYKLIVWVRKMFLELYAGL